MKKIYYFCTLAICLMLTLPAFAQRVVKIDPSTDPTMPADIFPEIMGDTTATGERVDNNTIYQLENGVVYVTSGRLVNTKDWPLQIEAEDLTDLVNKPIISRLANASGTYPDIGRPEGDVTFKNLWIVSGEKGALENHDWGKFRLSGAGTRVIIQDCIFEKERGGFLQFRADSIKCYVDNTIFRNGGNRRVYQGNGRGIDLRDVVMDTLIMTNCVVHNIQDRFLRSQGAPSPHNYIEIDHCTSFNTAGRHGHIQLGRVATAVVTNNIFINPIMIGSSPGMRDEQTQPDNDLHKVITLDTLYDNTALTIAQNNIFWTQDVLDYWASVDSLEAPGYISDLIKTSLGDDTTNAYFTEVLTLDSIPGTILQYVQDVHANPAATDMYDFIVEDVLVAGTAFDSGNLFDLSEFSPCYDESTMSASAGTDGTSIGAVLGCANLTTTSILRPELVDFTFGISPNPVNNKAQFSFNLENPGAVQLHVYDLQGRLVSQVQESLRAAGTQQIEWTAPAQLKSGLYIARLQVEGKVQSLKFVLN